MGKFNSSFAPFTVDVLGTEYIVSFVDDNSYKQLKEEENESFCDTSTKYIVVKIDLSENKKSLNPHELRLLRREVVKAFLYESGLSTNCYWAEIEEVLGWFSIQLPKITKALDLCYDKWINKDINKD